MTKVTIQEFISLYNEDHGYEDNPSEDLEYLTECLSEGIVQSSVIGEHRWYDDVEEVHKVTLDGEERFFGVPSYRIQGDMSAGDMDLDPITIKDVYEVFPKTKIWYE